MIRLFRGRAGVLTAIAAAITVAAFSAQTHVSVARAALCDGPCLQVDVIPGGGIDSSATVSGNFTVDIVARNLGSDPAGSFNFNLTYNSSVLSAGTPFQGPSASLLDCTLPAPTGRLPEDDPNADGDPTTGDALLVCFAHGSEVATDGVIGSVPFSVVGSGTSNLHLRNVAISDSIGIELVSCEPVNVYPAGGCADGVVSTNGAPPPPPPPPPPSGNECRVQFALDGETVQCDDGSRVRFVGVASPLGGDPGAGWATAVTNWFLSGKTISVETDAQAFDQFGSRWGYPHVTGTDGNDYNVSALLIYVGMAHHVSDGVNVRNVDWFNAAQVWARTACWNMWAFGNPFGAESGCR